MIRKAKLKEAEIIDKLGYKLWKHHQVLERNNKTFLEFEKKKKNSKKLFLNYVKTNIRSKNGLILVAEDKGKLIGYSINLIKKNIPIFKADKIGYMSDIYVDPKYRGKKLASKFKGEAFKWFKQKKIKFITIEVHSMNKPPHKIYKKWGFQDFHYKLIKKI